MKNMLKTALIVLINNALIMSSSATSLTALKKNDIVYYTGLDTSLSTDTTTTPIIIAPATYPY